MSKRYDTAKRVLESRTAEKMEGALLDVTTAGVLVAVFDTLAPGSQARFDFIPLDKLVAFCWSRVRA